MVLVKFLDSAVRLQLQAHPTAEFAKQHLDSNSGKAEAYYILDVRDDVEQAYVYLGFQRRLQNKNCDSGSKSKICPQYWNALTKSK